MTNVREVITEAIAEISRLRRENEILAAKVDVMDLFACVLITSAATRSHGESVDVVWKLNKALDEEIAADERTHIAT